MLESPGLAVPIPVMPGMPIPIPVPVPVPISPARPAPVPPARPAPVPSAKPTPVPPARPAPVVRKLVGNADVLSAGVDESALTLTGVVADAKPVDKGMAILFVIPRR